MSDADEPIRFAAPRAVVATGSHRIRQACCGSRALAPVWLRPRPGHLQILLERAGSAVWIPVSLSAGSEQRRRTRCACAARPGRGRAVGLAVSSQVSASRVVGEWEPHAAALSVPLPQQLAALGTVLCLYRPHQRNGLAGWVQAVRVEARTGMDSDGLRESLVFFDAQDRCCWRLYLLPDSDFLAWDRLLASLFCHEEVEPSSGVGERLWRRLAGRLRGEQWQARIVHLRSFAATLSAASLLARQPAVSSLGADIARRIAQAEGASIVARADDCCCASVPWQIESPAAQAPVADAPFRPGSGPA